MVYFTTLLFSIVMVSFVSTDTEPDTCLQEAKAFEQEWNDYFADTSRTPLEPEDFVNFESLNFFAFDEGFCREAHFEPLAEKEPITMQTTTGKDRMYLKAGALTFTLNDTLCQLYVYERPQLPGLGSADSTVKWFLPFKDHTNGGTTYGGGRYMDIVGRRDAGVVVLNFNKSYPPLCAFSKRFSCPIVPDENTLPVAVTAGFRQME